LKRLKRLEQLELPCAFKQGRVILVEKEGLRFLQISEKRLERFERLERLERASVLGGLKKRNKKSSQACFLALETHYR
jgi:hypothetical protein